MESGTVASNSQAAVEADSRPEPVFSEFRAQQLAHPQPAAFLWAHAYLELLCLAISCPADEYPGLFDGSRLIGFSIQEQVHNGYVIGHFGKAAKNYVGLNQFLENECAKICAQGSTYLNNEQDLGIEGLRRAKSLWRPLFFLKKYTISRREK